MIIWSDFVLVMLWIFVVNNFPKAFSLWRKCQIQNPTTPTTTLKLTRVFVQIFLAVLKGQKRPQKSNNNGNINAIDN